MPYGISWCEKCNPAWPLQSYTCAYHSIFAKFLAVSLMVDHKWFKSGLSSQAPLDHWDISSSLAFRVISMQDAIWISLSVQLFSMHSNNKWKDRSISVVCVGIHISEKNTNIPPLLQYFLKIKKIIAYLFPAAGPIANFSIERIYQKT
jgi:hypothetical protein